MISKGSVPSSIDIMTQSTTIDTINASNLPFYSKILPNGQKLYKRIISVKQEFTTAEEKNIDKSVPFNLSKITGIEIINGQLGDYSSFQVLDTPIGTISGTANALLNEFGTNVYIAKDFYKHKSSYDADLIKNMTLRLVYNISNILLPRTVYVNFIIHEVK